MISINKYGQNVNLSKVVEVNGKKTFSLDGIDLNKTLIIKVPKDVKFVSTLVEEDLKIEFKDKDGNIFELILKNMTNLLAQNDGDKLIEILRENTNETLASITDLTSALEAAAAGAGGAENNANSDNARNSQFQDLELELQDTTYDNDRVDVPLSSNGEILPFNVVFGANNAPLVTVSADAIVNEDESILIPFSATDLNNDTLTPNVTATNGIVTINANVITYTPNENFNGSDVITLSVNDGTTTTTQTINVIVNPVNDAPTIEVNSILTVDEDGTQTITFISTDIDANTLTPNVTATNGIVTINANVITYTPNENFNGSDVITLSVNDGTTTTTQTINVIVNPVNDAPTIEVNSILTVDEDGTQTITFISTDIDANTLTPNVTATNGIVTINGNVITYTPNVNFNGNDVITLTVNDGTTTTTQTINVTVNPVNDAPTIEVNSILTVDEDGTQTITFISNDIDADILTSNVTAINGIVTINANVITYTPNEDFNGSDVITLSVNDGTTTTTQTINVTVNPVNDAPIINVEPIIELSETDLSSTTTLPDVYYVISEEEMFEMLDVTDVDVNDGLSISLVSNSSVFASTNTGIINGVNGVVQLTQERIDTLGINAKVGDFFVFSNGFDGLGEDEIVNVSFEVVATDGKDNSATSKVNLVINGVNDAPIINVEPIIELSETDLSSTTTLPDVYYVISEEEMFEMLDVTDVDVNDGLSISLVSNSSVFASTNTGIINGVNGVVQLTQERIDTLGINAKVGDFFVFSNGFDGLGEDEIVNVSFEVVATDGKDNSATSKVNLVINGVNDAPIINVEPIIELSETDLSSTTTLPDVYYVISEEEMFEMLDVTDVDVNDGLSISLVSNSSVFASTNTGIINGVNGVVQLTQERIDTLGINAKVGDFFVFSNGFDGLGEDEIVNVSFEVVATDGKDNSATSKVNLVINGVNDAPITIDVSTQTQNDNSIKEYTGQLKATDVDLNDTLTYSVDSSSVNVSLTISNLNGLSTLVALNNPIVESVLLSLKPVITNFINTGDLSGFLTLNPQTIMTTKAIVGTLQEFLNVNSDLKDSIVLLKDFIIANKDEIIANTNLVAQDIVILQSLLTQENLIALENLYNSVNSFLDANPQIKELATTILADNIISPLELVTLNPILLAQIEGLRVQLKSIVDSNSTVLDLISINEVIAKLQEVITVGAVNQEVSIKTTVPETLANMIVTLDENTGEYTINNAFAEKFSSLGDLEISFDYKVIDSEGAESNISSASILITTEDVEEMTTSLDKEGSISFDNENIDLATILDNISSNIEIEDIDSIDLSNAEHILSNLTIEDFEAMVSDDSSNTLAINGENNDVIKLDLSIWSKEESDKDNNSEVENEDDGYIAYTATGTTEQTLTLLIDKDITVENI